MNEEYLIETKVIDYNVPLIQEKVRELKEKSDSTIDYIRNAYEFVRDEIPHSWDIRSEIVSRKASEVLKNKTGICWTKSCLLAALLRANGIPSGISYQLLTLAFPIREQYGEVDYRDNNPDLDERLVEILEKRFFFIGLTKQESNNNIRYITNVINGDSIWHRK